MASLESSHETIFSFERLQVWQTSRKLSREVCLIIRNFPQEERYALSAQLRRAIVSVTSNIAESSGRLSTGEKIHFISIAYGSLAEAYCQLLIAFDLEYINEEQLTKLKLLISEVAKMLRSLRHYFQHPQQQPTNLINS